MAPATLVIGLALGIGLLAMSRKKPARKGLPKQPGVEPPGFAPAPGQLETPPFPYDHYPADVSRQGFPAPNAPDQVVVNSSCTRINVPHAWFETVAAPQIQEKLVAKEPRSSEDIYAIAMDVVRGPLGSCPPDTPAMRELLNDVATLVETIYTG